MSPEEIVMIAAETPRDAKLQGRIGDIIRDIWAALDKQDIDMALVSAIWDESEAEEQYARLMNRRYAEEDAEDAEGTA